MKKVIIFLIIGICFIISGCSNIFNAVSNDYITIKKYDGLKIEKVKQEKVTDELVEETLNNKLKELSSPEIKIPKRNIKKGDKILLDCSAKDKKGNIISGTELTDYELEIGSKSFFDGWEDNCIGKPYNKEFTFNLKFPEGYGGEELSGKEAIWTVKAKGLVVGTKEVKLTDEIIKNLSETAKNEEELKKEIKANLIKERKQLEKQQLQTKIWEAIEKETTVKKYSKDVDKIIKSIVDEYKKQAKASGITYEEFLSKNNVNKKDFEADVKSYAEQIFKREQITNVLMDKLNIKLSKKDYIKKYKEYAKLYGFDNYKSLIKEAKEKELKKMVNQEKVGDWLINHSKQVEIKQKTTTKSQK